MADHSGFNILDNLEGGKKRKTKVGVKTEAKPKPPVKNGWEQTPAGWNYWENGTLCDTGKLYNEQCQEVTRQWLSPCNNDGSINDAPHWRVIC